MRDVAIPPRANTDFFSPLRIRHDDSSDVNRHRRAYRRYSFQLQRAVKRAGLNSPALVTFNPFVAAFCDTSFASKVTYYARDDWASHDDFAHNQRAYELSYEIMRERGVQTVAVSKELLDVLEPTGPSLVLPNAVDPAEWLQPASVPDWMPEGQVVLYTGVLNFRLDVAALRSVAEKNPEATILLLGNVLNFPRVAEVDAIPQVQIKSSVGRIELAGAVAASDVCIIPHSSSGLTRSMSPLKLYEYLAAGRPTVVSNLAPMRNVHPRVRLVDDSNQFGEVVAEELRAGPMSEDQRVQFISDNSWASRHRMLLDLAL